MTRTLRFAYALFIALSLAACSSLIPDQDVGDAFGLDGVEVTATAGVEAMAANAGPIGSTHLSGSFTSEIESDGFDAIPGFINVASLSDVVTIRSAVFLSAPGDVAFAPSYTITDASIALRISNAASALIEQTWAASGLDLTFSGVAAYDATSDRTTGTYAVAIEVPLVTLVAHGAAVNAYVDALGDGDTVDVAGTLTVDLQPAFPFGAELTVVLKSLGGTLTF